MQRIKDENRKLKTCHNNLRTFPSMKFHHSLSLLPPCWCFWFERLRSDTLTEKAAVSSSRGSDERDNEPMPVVLIPDSNNTAPQGGWYTKLGLYCNAAWWGPVVKQLSLWRVSSSKPDAEAVIKNHCRSYWVAVAGYPHFPPWKLCIVACVCPKTEETETTCCIVP